MLRSVAASVLPLLIASCVGPTNAVEGNVADNVLENRIFDAHLHAFPSGQPGSASLSGTLASMDAAGIDRAALHFINQDMYEEWGSAAPGRLVRGVSFPCWRDQTGAYFVCDWGATGFPDLGWLRAEAEAGRLNHLGEMSFIYSGVAPTDERMDPYWALADEFGLPVLVHANRGPPPDHPMRKMGCCPQFNADLSNPETLRPVLKKHPNLKIVLQHFGFPPLPMLGGIDYIEESIALMRNYPNVMAEMSTFHSVPFISTDRHAAVVHRLKEEGLLDRLMFATDNWPAEPVIAKYRAMTFLTEDEYRGIMHRNAVRLFGR